VALLSECDTVMHSQQLMLENTVNSVRLDLTKVIALVHVFIISPINMTKFLWRNLSKINRKNTVICVINLLIEIFTEDLTRYH
jgi:hypothetical protein